MSHEPTETSRVGSQHGSSVRTLDAVQPGETVQIAAIDGIGSFRRRLLELGLVAGTPITRQGSAPLGDPLTFRVRGAVLALRRTDAMVIAVAEVDESELSQAAK